ncbi:hypothetical protein [Vibrio sp. ER1A]|uniref:hypothetical protein n=1 Tax=Vibrio sp. ER1A TaxID=1517681 RepID=UPI0004DD15A3|nr:hypothetical protein [Vibrio sp. ER1A]KFA99467.1 hypothetical protein HW45_03655 [Vibrio sp. ER1A]
MPVYIPSRYLGSLNIESKAKVPTKTQSDIKKAHAKLQARIQRNLIGLPPYEQEYLFHPSRKWRMDYAWPDSKLALEVHGGHHTKGRHTRGLGFANDREKMNEAQLLGWIVIEVTTDNIPQMRGWIEHALDIRNGDQ